MRDNPIVIYTDHSINKTICYYFAKGSNSLMCHVKNFREFDKTIATYGFKRGTGDLLKKLKIFIILIMDILINQHEILKIKVQQCMILMDILGYLLMIFWHDGLGNRPDDRFRKLNINLKDTKKQVNI